jgi:hypothetical protein
MMARERLQPVDGAMRAQMFAVRVGIGDELLFMMIVEPRPATQVRRGEPRGLRRTDIITTDVKKWERKRLFL